MKTLTRILPLLFTFLIAPLCASASEDSAKAKEIVRAAVDYWRDKSSYTASEMQVKRPTWEREMKMVGWTKGMKKSLIRFTEPAKDAGNASLTINEDIWSYTPKVNRVIRIPASMKSQSWMGSDFSYRDLARSDEIVEDYTHKILETKQVDGHNVYVVEMVPHDSAPVVWGKEVLDVREDYVMLKHQFFDQDMKLVKVLETKEIRNLGGKLYPAVMRMSNVEKPEEWTEIRTIEAEFGAPVPDSTFTLSNLRNPRAR
ncbi:MAG: outer membrane lipoprotein-sorting protein [Bdellovibrionales bacterium]|nr:outer membrane lipoprotein-sorting protein [Bdellovibrionales bacterium]